MDIKIEANTVVANEGGFEPHPESYTPRVFCIVNPQWGDVAIYEILQNGQAILWPNLPNSNSFDCWLIYVSSLNKVDMHRVSKSKFQPKMFWLGVDVAYDPPCPRNIMFSAPKKAGFGPSTQKAIDDAHVVLRAPNPRRVTSEELDRIIKEYGRPYMSSGGNIVPYVSPLYKVGNDYYYTYDDLHPASQDPVPQADGDCPNPDVCGCGQFSELGPLSHLPERSH